MADILMIELPGCAKKRRYDSAVQQCGTPEAIIAAVEQYGLAVDAGYHGSVEVWRDDANQVRCKFTSHGTTESEQSGDIQTAQEWLEKWWPRQHEQ